MEVKLTHYTQNPLEAIGQAAQNCYDSHGDKQKLANQCYNSGHTATWEFCDFTFHIEGVSRALLAQLTRHRMASYAVRSQRYCVEGTPQYVIPPTIANNPPALEEYTKVMKEYWGNYNKFVSLGVAPEDARMLLPNACDTIIEVKMNGRALLHFMNERLCSRAQWEIRELARRMKMEINKVAPEFAEKCVPKCEAGKIIYCPEHKSCGRHKTAKEINEIIERADTNG